MLFPHDCLSDVVYELDHCILHISIKERKQTAKTEIKHSMNDKELIIHRNPNGTRIHTFDIPRSPLIKTIPIFLQLDFIMSSIDSDTGSL